MKQHKKLVLLLVLLLSLATGCTKDILKYENDPRVYFNERFTINATNSSAIYTRSFSFAPFPATVVDTTLYIKVKIQGLVAATNRTFGAEAIADGTTAITGTDYKLLPGTIKANESEGLLPVVLYRTPALKITMKQLKIRLADAYDFKSGTVENNVFTLMFNDDYIKPDNWDTAPGLKTYFGVFSVTKYKFIIQVLGRSDFQIQTTGYDPLKFSNADLLDKKAILKAALADYNNTHTPPLTDEFGLAVTFP